MIIFVVRVANSMTPRLLELLANVFQRVDHDAELAKPLVRDVSLYVLLERQVHLLEHVVPRDVSTRTTAHGCRSVLVPNCADVGTHHVHTSGLLDGICGILVLVRRAEQWYKVLPRPVERLVVVAPDRVSDREPRKQELMEQLDQDAGAYIADARTVWVAATILVVNWTRCETGNPVGVV